MSLSFDPRLPAASYPPGSLPPGYSLTTRYKSSSTTLTSRGGGAPWGLDQVPWGCAYNLGAVTTTGVSTAGMTQAQAAITQDNVALATAQAAQATAQALVTAKQAALDAATAAFNEASAALDQSQQAVAHAQTAVNTFTRRVAAGAASPGDLGAAQAALAAAAQDLLIKEQSYTTQLQAYEAAQSDLAIATAALGERMQSVATVTDLLAADTLRLAIADSNYANAQAAVGGPTDPGDHGYVTGYLVGSLAGPGLSSETLASNTFQEVLGVDEFGCVTESNAHFTVSSLTAAYQHLVTLSDSGYQLLLASGASLRLSWLVVTTSVPTETFTVTPAACPPGAHQCGPYSFQAPSTTAEPTVSYETQTEVLDAGDAVQQPDGTWQLAGTIHSVGAPDMGSATGAPSATVTIELRTALNPPTVAVSEQQFQGADRQRQGWPELFTPTAQAQAKRYLTLTATKAANAPAGANYSGAAQWVPPTMPPATLAYPLVERVTLTRDCLLYGPYDRREYFNDPLAVPSDHGRVQDALTLLVNNPPGLVYQLSDPQDLADILADAQGVRDAAWPEVDPANPGIPPKVPEQTFFPGAINFTSPDGDHVIAQKMRLKLSFSANDTRVYHTTTFDVTFRWAYKRRNLLTGEVTMEAHSKTVTFPDVVVTADPASGVSSTLYNYYTTDAEWTEIIAGENESVELVLLPGDNDDPHTFLDDGAVLSLVAAAE